MTDEEPPPSYESIVVCAPPFVPRKNSVFVPDQDSTANLKLPTAPVLDASSTSSVSSSNRNALSVRFPPLNDADIKTACSTYAGNHCCYGFGFVDHMTKTEMNERVAYHYTLESYGEKRETAEHVTPNNGSLVDGPDCGVPPDPWDIPVTPRSDFADHQKTVHIPHTTYLRVCTKCQGKRTTRCNWCLGVGGEGCLLCLFNEKNRPCWNCKYSNKRCIFCNGRGQVTCKKCNGQGILRCSKMLIVTWTNHVQHFVSNTLTLPAEEILEAEGKVLVTETAKELSPISQAPDASVNAASASLIERHMRAHPNELIVKQRHTLRAVPFTQIKYQWKNKNGEFYICGLDRKAYFDNYPQQCCCCSIM